MKFVVATVALAALALANPVEQEVKEHSVTFVTPVSSSKTSTSSKATTSTSSGKVTSSGKATSSGKTTATSSGKTTTTKATTLSTSTKSSSSTKSKADSRPSHAALVEKAVAEAVADVADAATREDRADKKPEDVVPNCAMPCITTYVKKHTKCHLDDYVCICKHKEIKDRDAITCVVNGCGYSKAKNKVLPAVKQFCKFYQKL